MAGEMSLLSGEFWVGSKKNQSHSFALIIVLKLFY
jgi:hypothetical protein